MKNRAERNGQWKGGQWLHSKGYLMVLAPGHPACNCRDYAPLHRKVFFDYHGWLPGPGEHIHHFDEDKLNNEPSNLMPIENTTHGRVHLTSERARKIGQKGGRKTARTRKKARRGA